MRIVRIQENGNLFKDIINSDQPKVNKEFILNLYETLLKGKVLNELDSLTFYKGLEKINVKFYCQPVDEIEGNVFLETEEKECDSCLVPVAKTKLERLEEIFEKTISSRSELNKAYHKWALKNHPDKFPYNRKEEANRSFQEVIHLLN